MQSSLFDTLLSNSSGSSHTAGVKSNDVDLYNATAGTWSTVQLSVARRNLAATTVRNLALFAGGYGPGGMLFCAGVLQGCFMI